MIRLAILVSFALAACHGEDECDRAIARQARIAAARHRPRIPRGAAELFREECHDPKASRYDPVLRCLMSSPTDDAAGACIDRIVRDVVHGPAGGSAVPDGKGLNPLLDPSD